MRQHPVTRILRRIGGGPLRLGAALLISAVALMGSSDAYAAEPIISSATVRTVRVRFKPTAVCSGVDGTASPVAIMAPFPANSSPGNTKALAEITPTGQFSRVAFVSDNTAVATVNPPVAESASQELQVNGVSQGATLIRARTNTSSKLRLMETYGRPRRELHVGIHAITQLNDDVQVTPKGGGPGPNFVCITSTDGLHWIRGDDDQIDGLTIRSGQNGICSSIPGPGDVAVVPQNHSFPCITPGSNGVLDSIQVVGTNGDLKVGQNIEAGANGICDSDTDVAPKDVPTAQQLFTALEAVWGKQTNIHFTVDRTDQTLDYDLNHDGIVTFKTESGDFTDAELRVFAQAANPSAAIDIYYVRAVPSPAVGVTLQTFASTWIGENKVPGSVGLVTAHEIGHQLDLDVLYPADPVTGQHHSLNQGDLMYKAQLPAQSVACELRLPEWKVAWSLLEP